MWLDGVTTLKVFLVILLMPGERLQCIICSVKSRHVHSMPLCGPSAPSVPAPRTHNPDRGLMRLRRAQLLSAASITSSWVADRRGATPRWKAAAFYQLRDKFISFFSFFCLQRLKFVFVRDVVSVGLSCPASPWAGGAAAHAPPSMFNPRVSAAATRGGATHDSRRSSLDSH